MPGRSELKVACALINLGDQEVEQLARERLDQAGHPLIGIERLAQDPARLKGVLVAALSDPRIEAVVVMGGHELGGVADLVQSLMEQPLVGFQEVFRWLTFQDLGSRAIFCRACAGFTKGRVLVCLPGGVEDVRRGLERLLMPELRRMRERARELSER